MIMLLGTSIANNTGRLWDTKNHRTSVWTAVTAAVVTTGMVWSLIQQRRRQWNSKSAREERSSFQDLVVKTLAGPNPQMVSNGDVEMLTTHYKSNSSNGSNSNKVTAVLIHGFGCTSLEFAALRQELEHQVPHLGVFAYDRILFVQQQQQKTTISSNSSKSNKSRNAPVLAEELHCLLQNRKDIQPPYLLIGHSYGGLLAQYYAYLYPDHVAGMVLLDPAHEHQFQEFPRDFTMGFTCVVPMVLHLYQRLAWTGFLQVLDHWGMFNFPPTFLFSTDTHHHHDHRQACVKLYSNGFVWKRVADELKGCFETFHTMNINDNADAAVPNNNNNNNSLLRQQQETSSAKVIPAGLVIAGHRQYSPTLFPQAVTAAFLKMHESMYNNNNNNDNNGKLFMASQSDHWIHMQEPKVVVQAIEYVLQKINDKQ
jgi:pimeloyl-ACP methyl ester carboxylesterase